MKACHICGESVSKLYYHIQTIHGEVVCICGEKFSKEFEFDNHKYSFSMDESKKHLLSYDDTFMLYNQGKAGRNHFPCTRCHQAFSNNFLLRRHMLDNHWAELKQEKRLFISKGKYKVKKIFCDYEGCEKYFMDQHDKRNHVSTIHTKKRDLQCDQCTKTFYSSYTLNGHKRSLHVVDPTVCKECGITLPNKYRLKEHLSHFHQLLQV